MYAKVTFSQGLPENAHTVVLSFGDPAGRLDRDFWARDIECRNLTASEVVEGRELTAREAVRSEDFVSGFAGRGFRILEDGTGEMRKLTLHEALEVPELRYNRITATGGQLWVTSAGTVRTATDNGNGTWTLAFKLEEGEAHEFDKGDILRAVYHTPTGFQTGIYRVTESVDMSSVRIVVVEGIDPQAAMTVVRTGNYSDATRQNSIYLDGYHGYERVLRGVDSPEIVPEHVVYQAGLLDGLTTESFGPLEGIGVYCGNLYATGSLRVKVNGEDKDVGTQFEVTAEGISSLATKSDALDGRLTTAESSITQQAGLIETKVSQSTFDEMGNRVSAAESSITQQADEIALRVTEDQCQSLIEQKVNSLELGVTTAELETVGIKIEGADKGVHVRADQFDVSATSGAKLLEASADGNRVTMRNLDIDGSATIANGATIGDVVVQGGALYWSKNGYTASVGSPVMESGDTVVGQFIAPDDFITGNPVVAVMVQGDILFNRGGIRNFSLYMEVIDRSKVAEGSECVCINSEGISVQLPDLGTNANGRVIYIHRRGYGEVVIRPRQESTSIAAGEKIMWGENNSTSDYAIPKRGYVVRAVRYVRTWYLNLMGW